MATYALYNASLGASYANVPVKIFDVATGSPAIVMASATGGLLNSLGLATLDGSGNLAVYLDNSKTWQVEPAPLNQPTASSSNTQESTQLLVKTAVQTIATNTSGGGGSATAANQTTGNTSLANIDTKIPAKGSATSANATPVVVASDQAAIPVTVSGVATAANQSTANTSLASIDTKVPAKGSATSANSTPVVIASDQAAVPVTVSGVATAANQTTANTSLATIATNTTNAGAPVLAAGSNTIGGVKLVDSGGTNQATIKAASTAAVATDPALVVALSPNNPVTVGAPADVSVSSTNITAQNTNPTSGTATANSTIAVTLSGQNIVTGVITANTLGASVTVQVSYDGSNWVSLVGYSTPNGSSANVTSSSTIATGTTGQFQWQVAGAKQFRLSANTATVSGTLTASLNASVASAPIVINSNITQLTSSVIPAVMTQVGGGANGALGTFLNPATAATDVSASSWAASSGNATVSSDYAGAAISADINLSVYTPGSAAAIDIWLQWSPDNGTTYYDIWQCERLTAAGHVFIPAIVIPGRRRFRWQNVNSSNVATAATTATVTVTVMRMSVAPMSTTRQYFDRTAGVLAGTASTNTAWYDVSGCRAICAYIPVGTASGPASYQLQFSSDGTNVLPANAAAAATQSTTTAYPATPGLTARFVRLAVTTAATSQTAATTPIVITGA